MAKEVAEYRPEWADQCAVVRQELVATLVGVHLIAAQPVGSLTPTTTRST
ncbi:MAG: hypothetical protein V9F00_16270 [Nocardioides sp.]|jgi:hypothetical protein